MAVGFAAGLYLVWKMAEGPRRARIHNIERGALPIAVAVRRRVVDDGEAGAPSKAETDTYEPVVAVGPSPLKNSGIVYVGAVR